MHVTGMSITLVLLTFFALIAAIGAISRMQSPVKNKSTSTQSSSSNNVSSGLGVQDVMAESAERPQLQPDIDSVEIPSTISQDASETPIDIRVVPPFVPQPELEVPFATSLKVSDVIHPSEVEPQIDLPSHPISPQSHHETHSSVVEEVTQLEQGSEVIDRLAQQAQDPDGTMRVAVAAMLGELAVQGRNREQIIALLNQLSQDADPQVRVQAISSMGMIPPDLPNAIV